MAQSRVEPRAKSRDGEWLLASVLALAPVVAGVAILTAKLGLASPIVAVVLATLAGLWILCQPREGLLLLLGLTMVAEQIEPPGGVRMLTANIPFFHNINGFTSLPIPAAPAELVMVLIAIGAAAVGIRQTAGPARLPNPLRWPVALVAVTIVFGLAWGLSHGGTILPALWELRAMVYMLLFVIVVPFLIRTMANVTAVLWIFVLGGWLKALEGLWTLVVTLHFDYRSVETLVGHDDALFFSALLVLLAALRLWRIRQPIGKALLALAPLLVVELLATQRRAAILALLLGLGVVYLFALHDRFKAVWRQAALIGTTGTIFLAAVHFGAVPHNSPLYQPVRAVTSPFDPASERDASSNAYREFEKSGLVQTIRDAPWIGIGFGRPYDVSPKVFDIGFPLYEYIPHNDILRWLTKTGFVGFAIFWLFFSSTLLTAGWALRTVRDPLLKALAAFAAAFIAMQVFVSWVDMLMYAYRPMILMGILIGLAASLQRIQAASDPDAQ